MDNPGFESRQGQEFFLFSKMSRSTLKSNHPPVQWVTGFFSWGKAARA
jgi:hypothetical protein